MPIPPWMIYGAYGFTGKLVAEEAVRRGHRPILAGRSEMALAPLAERLGLQWVAFSLDDTAALEKAVSEVSLVYHSAGPFIYTSEPMVCACLKAGVHYLDINGEIAVLERVFTHNEEAQQRGIVLLPSAGFDVIPSDCLAKYVADQLPGAVELEMAVQAITSPSIGTSKTGLELVRRGGLVRRNGELVPYPLGKGAKRVRFSNRTRTVMPIPWADLFTAYHSTGIPNMTSYFAFPRRQIRLARVGAPLARLLLKSRLIHHLANQWIDATVRPPRDTALQEGRSYLWASVRDEQGNKVEAWLETPEGYRYTALAGVRAVEKVLETQPSGALTPAQALGKDFALEVEGTKRLDSLEG